MISELDNGRLGVALEFSKRTAGNRRQKVYAIQCNEFVKIGIAFDVPKRLKMLQAGCPYALRVVGCYATSDAASVEQALHSRFRAYQGLGEWFALPQNIMENLAGIIATVEADSHPHSRLRPICTPARSPRKRRAVKLSGYWAKDAERARAQAL